MTVSPALRRLLHVLEMKEEQARQALEAAAGELRRLEIARAGTMERERRGRALVVASTANGEVMDRLAGIEETRLARRAASALKARQAEAEREMAARRETLVAKRVERRQTETLIREAEARAARERERRAQRALDDWHLSRSRSAGLVNTDLENMDIENTEFASRSGTRPAGGEET